MVLQRAVFERDKYQCQYCGKVARWKTSNGAGIIQLSEKKPTYYNCGVFGRHDHKSFEIDHVIPISRGGKNVLKNLKLACRCCNRTKGDRVFNG